MQFSERRGEERRGEEKRGEERRREEMLLFNIICIMYTTLLESANQYFIFYTSLCFTTAH